LAVSEHEEAEIRRLLMAGWSNKAVARSIGCDPSTVAKRRALVADDLPEAFPSLPLRAPGWASRLVPSFAREARLDPAALDRWSPAEHIAAELGVNASHLREKYAPKVITGLRGEGVACRCGKELGHKGQCSGISARERTPPTANKPVGRSRQLPVRVAPAVYQDIYRRYRNGQGRNQISREVNICTRTVRKLVNYWAAHHHNRGRERRCRCGKPADHTDGCIRSRREFVGKRMQSNIDARVMAGETSHQIADALGLVPDTVARHSLEAREARCAAGLTCGCGRAIGHPGWCSGKWDDAGLRRGRPFEPALERRAMAALLTGRPVQDIAPELGVSITGLRKLQASFTADQSANRAKALRERRKLSDTEAADRIMAKVQAADRAGAAQPRCFVTGNRARPGREDRRHHHRRPARRTHHRRSEK
jgi:hypothetical protein